MSDSAQSIGTTARVRGSLPGDGRGISDANQLIGLINAVCRIETDTSWGTGFVIHDRILMTNHHVVSDRATARNAKAQFCLRGRVVTVDLDPDALFTTSPVRDLAEWGRIRRYGTVETLPGESADDDHLDYTVVGLQSHPALVDVFQNPIRMSWGIDFRYCSNVFTVAHPGGGPKMIALTDTTIQSWREHTIEYDTEGENGASGGPVVALRDNALHLVALHHGAFGPKGQRARYVGIRMESIVRDLVDSVPLTTIGTWFPVSPDQVYEISKWQGCFDKERSLRILRLSAKDNCASAQNDFGVVLFRDNKAKALKWFRRASANGNAMGSFNVGYCMQHGPGTDRADFVTYFPWYQKAFRQIRNSVPQEIFSEVDIPRKLEEHSFRFRSRNVVGSPGSVLPETSFWGGGAKVHSSDEISACVRRMIGGVVVIC